MTDTIRSIVLYLTHSTELSILSKATALLVLGLAAAWLAERSRASVRHLALAATFAVLIVLPFLVIGAPRVPIGITVSPNNYTAIVVRDLPPGEVLADNFVRVPESRASVVSSVVPSWPSIARFAWIAGVLAFLAPLALNLWSMRRLRRGGLPWPEMQPRVQSLAAGRGIRGPVELLVHENIAAPLTCGWLHPAILLPDEARNWPEGELRCALVHELEHVRRGDWATQLMARTICAAYWFHPLVWMGWRRMCLEAERTCDDAVIQIEERTGYADQLVSLARRMSASYRQPALGMAHRSDLSMRVSAVLDASRSRGRAGRLATASAVLAATLAVLAIAPLQAVAQSAPGRRVTALNRALFEAAEAGDMVDIEQLIGAGADVNGVLSGDGSPLIGAARRGRLSAVRMLLDRGADVNKAVPGDGNPLIMAAREGHVEVVKLLLDRGARINLVVPDDENALIQASASGRLEVVKLLVNRGADINARVWVEQAGNTAGEWRSPLSMAKRGRHTEVAAYLTGMGARE